MSQPYFLNDKLIGEAIDMVIPAVQACIASKVFKRPHLYIIVSAGPSPVEAPGRTMEGFSHDAVFVERSIGSRAEWEYLFDQYGREKAFMAWLRQMDTVDQINNPMLLATGNTVYGGGVYHCGASIGVSGQDGYHDHMIGRWIAAAIEANCRREFAKFMASGQGFLV